EVIRRLNDRNEETLHPIELIVFSSEESSRFGIGKIGSKAMSGTLKGDIPTLKYSKDRQGMTIDEAFKDCGLDFKKIETSKREKKELKVFLELHIEQGPVLETEGKQVGIVNRIAAPT